MSSRFIAPKSGRARFLAGTALVLLVAAGALVVADHPPAGCTCAAARQEHGWCAACRVGYVASFPVRLSGLHEAIHPHGHPVEVELTPCAGCKQAIYTDGWCAECRAGYYRNQAYFSKLTHALARGQVVDRAALSCDTCRHSADRSGWCSQCGLGWFGNVRFEDRAAFDAVVAPGEIFFAALARAGSCEGCAVAMITDARCVACRITFHDGRPVTSQ